ncbi:ABC transporter substrate-binding protein [Corynebacterium sp.]|uniref:ABC transporter substrate-binding protein n=1 Tax=Corynebacterium sp. TaxID=1720 RepID=UPI0026DC198C|nr:ABC transporter substrate-binding protein [Corynebacterium sp.]MDO5032745.1 ABC transporter substrate-binding protein [Corynebacterium sp.]
MRRSRARLFSSLATLAAAAVTLSACTAEDPTAQPGAENGAAGGKEGSIVIGTANFPESEIIGQLWAATLEAAGFDVEVKSGIGSREVYMKALESGEVDIVPEYTGNLAQFYSAEVTPGADADAVYSSLNSVLPEELKAAKMAPAESKDAYHVTEETARTYQLATLGDLKKLQDAEGITIAANPELAQRPYGPRGLAQSYGLNKQDIKVNAISDGGGPLTIAALLEGQASVADVYTTSPTLDREGKEINLVRLEDPKNLIPAQNLVPIYRAESVDSQAVEALDELNADLSTEDVVAMNLRNVGAEKAEPATIAREFLSKA